MYTINLIPPWMKKEEKTLQQITQIINTIAPKAKGRELTLIDFITGQPHKHLYNENLENISVTYDGERDVSYQVKEYCIYFSRLPERGETFTITFNQPVTDWYDELVLSPDELKKIVTAIIATQPH